MGMNRSLLDQHMKNQPEQPRKKHIVKRCLFPILPIRKWTVYSHDRFWEAYQLYLAPLGGMCKALHEKSILEQIAQEKIENVSKGQEMVEIEKRH